MGVPPHASRKEMEILSRKKDILDVAARLFSEKGFHDVSMDEIAEHVGISKGTVYLYYDNKETLFQSILTEKTKVLYRDLKAIVENGEPAIRRIEYFVEIMMDYFNRNQPIFKLFHTEKIQLSMETHSRLHDDGILALRTYFELITRLMRDGQDEGLLRSMEPDVCAKSLMGLIHAYSFHRMLSGNKTNVQEETARIMDLFLNGTRKENA
jgi:AcrR family transcriptional regulator